MHMQSKILIAMLLAMTVTPRVMAETLNGNDFALYFSEAKTDQERSELMAEHKGKNHFFRYLCVVKMDEGMVEGRPFVEIRAREPSSLLYVTFRVTKRLSVQKLWEDPATTIGDAVAATGRLVSADPKAKLICVRPVIIRHKDRLEPKVGKELLGEVAPSAVFYSYTGSKKAVQLSYQDRDLLKHKGEILGKQGKDAWADFLAAEIAKRDRARALKRRENTARKMKELKEK
jgi:hypothetical protein